MQISISKQIEWAWAEHGTSPDVVLAQIPEMAQHVTAPAEIARLAKLIRHFVGEERGEWRHAADLCAVALDNAVGGVELALAEGELAICELVCNREALALAALCRALAHDPANGVAHTARINLLVAAGLMGAHKAGGRQLAGAALALAASLQTPSDVDRELAIAANNFGSFLLDHKREPEDDQLMIDAAVAANHLWLKAGNWVNHERAAYLLALVYNRLGRAHEARAAAIRGLDLIAANGKEEVDEAFLRLALCQALRRLGNGPVAEAELVTADALAASFDPSLREWYAGERQRAQDESVLA